MTYLNYCYGSSPAEAKIIDENVKESRAQLAHFSIKIAPILFVAYIGLLSATPTCAGCEPCPCPPCPFKFTLRELLKLLKNFLQSGPQLI